MFNSEGRVVTAISVMGTTDQVTPENIGALSSELKRTADSISRLVRLLASRSMPVPGRGSDEPHPSPLNSP